jgi:hypothetical protein
MLVEVSDKLHTQLALVPSISFWLGFLLGSKALFGHGREEKISNLFYNEADPAWKVQNCNIRIN